MSVYLLFSLEDGSEVGRAWPMSLFPFRHLPMCALPVRAAFPGGASTVVCPECRDEFHEKKEAARNLLIIHFCRVLLRRG
jgi:hypothetical protein